MRYFRSNRINSQYNWFLLPVTLIYGLISAVVLLLVLLMFVGGLPVLLQVYESFRFVILLKVTWQNCAGRSIHDWFTVKMVTQCSACVVGNVTRFLFVYDSFSTLTLLISLTGLSMLDMIL